MCSSCRCNNPLLRVPSSHSLWRAIHYALRRGKIEAVFGISFVAYHLIEFTREALRGEQNASFYSQARMELFNLVDDRALPQHGSNMAWDE
jgi:hypothetical protein